MYTYARTNMHMHACRHALMKKCTWTDRMHVREVGHRSIHPTDMLTSLLSQGWQAPLDLAGNDEVKTAFAENTVITGDNKNTLLLACARVGLVPLLRAVLQAGANSAHTEEVRVRV